MRIMRYNDPFSAVPMLMKAVPDFIRLLVALPDTEVLDLAMNRVAHLEVAEVS